MLIIGLTGGIASGKSFVEMLFVRSGVPVFDADLAVHRLLSSNKTIFKSIQKFFPKTIVDDKIDRKILGAEVFSDKEKLQKLEQIIYPFLHKTEAEFIKFNRRNRRKFVVLNIPLLFEKGGYKKCDKTIAIIANKQVRLSRFKKRFDKLDNEKIIHKFNQINTHQVSDIQRLKYADFIIYNSLSKAFCQRQVKTITKTICNLQNPSL